MRQKFTLLCSLLLVNHTLFAMQTEEYRFAYIGHEASRALSGARQGIAEANLQGQFIGKKYAIDSFTVAGVGQLDANKYIAILTDVKSEQLLELAKTLPATQAIFNLGAKDNALRLHCQDKVLHVIASDKMYTDAKQQWLTKYPDADITVSGWHPDFVKFAARDLNKRYLKNANMPMDEFAWAGWAAIKMTSDKLARGKNLDAATILKTLKTDLSFDGQKGMTMNFRQTGQLRQSLLVADSNNTLLGEAPVRGVVKPNDVDSLGIKQCQAKE